MSAVPASLETRNKILAVALELFRAQGYDATSLRQIAERLDLTKAAVYYHFPAKEDLVLAIAERYINGLRDIVARDDEPPEAWLNAYLALMLDAHDAVNFLWHDPGAWRHLEVGRAASQLFDKLQFGIAGRTGKVADHVRAGCALGAINSLASLPVEDARRAKSIAFNAATAALQAR